MYPYRNKTLKRKAEKDGNYSVRGPRNTAKDFPELKEVLHLDLEQWDKLGLQLKNYKDRTYEVLDNGWSAQVYYTIYDKLKLPCAFSFNNAKIDRSFGGTFLNIKGHCTERGSEIHLHSSTEPNDKGIDLHASSFDTRGLIHTKKRQLRGDIRHTVAHDLVGKSAYLWRREEADKRMKFGDAEPADLYTANILRKAKQ